MPELLSIFTHVCRPLTSKYELHATVSTNFLESNTHLDYAKLRLLAAHGNYHWLFVIIQPEFLISTFCPPYFSDPEVV